MGASGADIQLSPLAGTLFPYSVECKARAKASIFKFLEQAQTEAKREGNGREPLVVLKANNKKPVVIVDLDHFFSLLERIK